jgi:hypothetical protein
MHRLGRGQGTAQVSRDISIASRSSDPVAKDSAQDAPHATRAFVTAVCLDLAKYRESLVRCDSVDRVRADQWVGHTEQPANLVERNLGASLTLELCEQLFGNILEGDGVRELRHHLGTLLFEDRIKADGDRLARLVTFLAGVSERSARPRAEMQGLLFARKPIPEAPQLGAARLNEEEKSPAIGQLIGLRLGLGGCDLELS